MIAPELSLDLCRPEKQYSEYETVVQFSIGIDLKKIKKKEKKEEKDDIRLFLYFFPEKAEFL